MVLSTQKKTKTDIFRWLRSDCIPLQNDKYMYFILEHYSLAHDQSNENSKVLDILVKESQKRLQSFYWPKPIKRIFLISRL